MPERITNTNQDGAGADPLALPPGQAVSVTAADGARLEGFRGERDRATPVRVQRARAALTLSARLTLLPGCGHQVMFDAPDEVSRLIGEMAHTSGQA